MIPTHGFVSDLLARRTRSLGKGGRRGAVVIVRGGIFSGRRFDGGGVWGGLARGLSVVAAGGRGEGGFLGRGQLN